MEKAHKIKSERSQDIADLAQAGESRHSIYFRLNLDRKMALGKALGGSSTGSRSTQLDATLGSNLRHVACPCSLPKEEGIRFKMSDTLIS